MAVPVAATGLVVGLYLFLAGESMKAMGLLAASAIILVCAKAVSERRRSGRTQYREARWTIGDSAIAATSITAIFSVFWTLHVRPEALRYEPFPDLSWPDVWFPLVIALMLLVSPAIVSMRSEDGRN